MFFLNQINVQILQHRSSLDLDLLLFLPLQQRSSSSVRAEGGAVELRPGGRANPGEHAKETRQEVPQLFWKGSREEALPPAGLSRPRHLPAKQPGPCVCILLSHFKKKATVETLLANLITARYWDKQCRWRLTGQICRETIWKQPIRAAANHYFCSPFICQLLSWFID